MCGAACGREAWTRARRVSGWVEVWAVPAFFASMGVEHLWNLHHVPGARVTAIADPNGPSREFAVAADEGRSGFEVFTDHRDLLASGLVDAVVVATPNMTHRQVLDDVLPTDLHVLVEKPLCTTVADCDAVLAAAEGR